MLKKTNEMMQHLKMVKNGDVTGWWNEWKKMKHAEKYGAKNNTLIDWYLWLQELINEFNEEMFNSHPIFKKIKNGTVIKNSYGKHLYFKLEDNA